MARKIRFPLKMKNGAEVRSLDELKENFDLESVLTYYVSGQLIAWLKNYNYDKTTADTITKVEALDKNAPDISKQLCEVLGVEYVESEDVDLAEAKEKLEREKILKQLLTEEQMKFVATNQKELDDLYLLYDAETIILAFGCFYIYYDNIKYIILKETDPLITNWCLVEDNNINDALKYANEGIGAAQFSVSMYYCGKACDAFESNGNKENAESIKYHELEEKYRQLAVEQKDFEAIDTQRGYEEDESTKEYWFSELVSIFEKYSIRKKDYDTQKYLGELAWRLGKIRFHQNKWNEALKWYYTAVKYGDIHSMSEIGFIYREVEQNKTLAIEWYEKAVASGDRYAIHDLEKLGVSLDALIEKSLGTIQAYRKGGSDITQLKEALKTIACAEKLFKIMDYHSFYDDNNRIKDIYWLNNDHLENIDGDFRKIENIDGSYVSSYGYIFMKVSPRDCDTIDFKIL